MVGGEKAYHFLVENGFDDCYAERVKQCIQTHRYRKDNLPQSLEAKILFDADKLDVAGAIGVPSFLQEYKYKLEKLYSNFYTAKGKELAAERQGAAVTFYNNLYAEASGSYENGKEELSKIIF